jgi:Ca2+/H+ antiporter
LEAEHLLHHVVPPRSDHSTYNRGKPNAGHDLAMMKDHENPEGAPNPNDESLAGLLKLSRGTSIILLSVYFIYLYFQVRRLILTPLGTAETNLLLDDS